MTTHEYPYTFTEAMGKVSQRVKVVSQWAEDNFISTLSTDIYHLDDNLTLINVLGHTPTIVAYEIDSMWRTIE